MKKLITISILTAALAASSAFAIGNGGRDSGHKKGAAGYSESQGVSAGQVYVGKNAVSNKQSRSISNALFFIQKHLNANADVDFKSAYIEKNSKGNWTAVAKYTGNAQSLSAKDLALLSKKANKHADETLCASDGMMFAMGNPSSRDRNPVNVFKVKQARGSLSLTQVDSNSKEAAALVKKITNAKHSNLKKIVAKEDNGSGRGRGR